MVSQEYIYEDGELSFKGKSLKLDTATDADCIAEAIKKVSPLKALRLEGNTVGLDASKVIAQALMTKPEFEYAYWSDMYTGRLRAEIPPSLDALGGAIISAKAHLHELDLSDNAFGPDGVKGIRRLLVSSACYSLKVLKLNNNGLGIGGGKILSEALIECHTASKLVTGLNSTFELKTFISGRNRLEDAGATALSKAFEIIGSLEEVTMPQNGIRPAGVAALASGLKSNTRLRVLNINDNTCTASGAKAVAECFPHFQKLEVLNLGDCLLKDTGASAIAAGISSNMPLLKELIMSYNEIRIDGALATVEAMRRKDNLTLLNLDGNQLGDDGATEVEDQMAALGRINALASFDENEDPDDEDDEDDDGEEDGNDATHNEDDDEILSQIDQMGLGRHDLNTSNSQMCTLEDMEAFVENPSSKKWKQIPVNQQLSLLTETVNKNLMSSSENIGNAFVKISNSLKDDKKSLGIVSDALLGTAFKSLKSEDIITNLFIAMGLLKGESKSEKPVELKGVLCALAHTLDQDYFPKSFAHHFIAFLMKSNPVLDACPTERHQLLQLLHAM